MYTRVDNSWADAPKHMYVLPPELLLSVMFIFMMKSELRIVFQDIVSNYFTAMADNPVR